MSRFKKIVIINHYPFNKGDHAVLRAMITVLSSCWPDAKIYVSSYDEKTTKLMNTDIESFPWPLNVKKVVESTGIKRYFYAIILLLMGLLGILIKNTSNKKFRNVIKDADIVLVPGGHLFTTMNNILSILSYSLSILVAKRYNRKVYILSQTIGPFEGKFSYICEWASKKAIQNCEWITIREKSSLYHFKKWNIRNFKMAGEIVFLLKPKRTDTFKILDDDNLKIGVTIHHSYFRYWMSEDEYIRNMANMISWFINNLNANVYFIPMEYNITNKNEIKIINNIIKRVNVTNKKIYILPTSLSPEETLYVISKMDIMIPTKTHSVIMSLKANTPLVAIAYHKKTYEFMNDFGLGLYTVDLSNINDFSKVIEKISMAINNKTEIKNKISTHISEQIYMSLKNFELLEKEVGGDKCARKLLNTLV